MMSKIKRIHQFWMIIFLVFFAPLQACTIKNIPKKHIVMFNKKGTLVDPSSNFIGKHFTGFQYPEVGEPDRYFENIMTGLKNYADEKERAGKPKKILFFFHGGLNTQQKTIKRATDRYQEVLEGGGYYPIFVNWQPSLTSTYSNHLFNIRQGKDWGWKTSILAPFYFGSDIARGAVRFPMISLSQIHNDVMTLPFMNPKRREMCVVKQLTLAYQNDPRQAHETIAISLGKNELGWGDYVVSGAKYTVSLPVKWVLSPFLLDSFGSSAWDIMRRNTHLLFERDSDSFTGSADSEPSGGLYRFMKKLREEIRNDMDQWEITLVGHSMGAMVMNELIHNFSDIHFKNIVYMAGAATIRDYQDTVFPYMSMAEHQNTTVYHLTLHPISEIRDRWGDTSWWSLYIDWPMRGSLLVWIDNFLSNPETPPDRTVGRLTNLMGAIHNTPDRLKSRINIKTFGVGQKTKDAPQKHGDFTKKGNKQKFWDPEFWKVAPPAETLENLNSYQCG